MNLLRFFTAGNVDDGKSTLIGRLLFDSQAISTDIIETLTRQSKSKTGNTEIDLALLTDGLRAEREQGITIDVAYKYFTTAKRKFIIADTPGHSQYTRNMFTGASNSDLAIILIDARHGVTEQTKRHTIISSILRIPHILVCINKMDLVNYSEEDFKKIEREYLMFAKQLDLKDIVFIPVSALEGDNVVASSQKMVWYHGKTLLDILETLEVKESVEKENARFQVQYVIRPQADNLHDYRGFAGKVLSGVYKKGQRVLVLPSAVETTIDKIEINREEVNEAGANRSVVFHLTDDVDVSRGNSIVPLEELPSNANEITATICWMDNTDYIPGQKILLQQNSFRTKAVIKEVISKLDIHSYKHIENDSSMKLNDLCKVLIKTAELVSFDSFADNRNTGAFILINENTNNTIAAGTID
ncbi:MAG: sulfate adenylyltransferase [Bacteroidetes bacterium]|jgi:sulfate adenylyltransferase subunit 1|nr:sulfate adenylyltransferase [Bacteroidota bacterium]MDF2453149.1 sulfate adenylyltransferase [Bacteroidota bacterium]